MLEAFEGAWHPDPEDVVINIVPEDSWLPWLVPPLSSMAAYLQPELSPPLLRSFLNLQQPSLRLPRCVHVAHEQFVEGWAFSTTVVRL